MSSSARLRSALALFLLASASGPAAIAQVVDQLTDYRAGVNVPGRFTADGGTYLFTSTFDPVGTNPTGGFQLFARDVAGATFAQWTDDPRGAALAASVSDDGSRVVFIGRADLVGSNPDRSVELFALDTATAEIRQLTAATLGSVGLAALSGDGGTAVFTATADLTGGNPDRSQELFAVEWDGTGLRQLTSSAGDSGSPTISDDGTRVAFLSAEDLVGANPDRSSELFAVAGDGSGLRQLTDSIGGGCALPWIAGNGSRIAFQCNGDLTGGNPDLGDEVFLVEWDGTGLRQLTSSTSLIGDPFAGAPSMTDDGQTVFYHSNQNNFLTNIDGNVEIWRIGADGTGRTALTSTILDIGSLLPVASGDGSRVAYVSISDPTGGNPDGNLELYLMTGTGASDEQLTDTTWGWTGGTSTNGPGDVVAFTSSADLTGENPEGNGELFRVDADGSALTQLTSTSTGDASSPSMTADGARIAFASTADLTGENADGSSEVFVIGADGAGLDQLTDAASLTGDSVATSIARDGSWIAFVSGADPFGTNLDGNDELFAIRADGTGLVQLTDTPTGAASAPSVDGDGTWIAFAHSGEPIPGGNPEGNRELFVVRTDGAGLAQRTATAAGHSDSPAITADGSRVAFRATADLLGTNVDGNAELFVIGVDGSQLSQWTDTLEGAHGSPAWDGSGDVLTFVSSSPYAGPNPDGVADLWSLSSGSATLARVTANRSGGLPGGIDALLGGGSGPAVSGGGDRIAFGGLGDLVGNNPDLLPETFLIALDRPWTVRFASASPAVLTWDAAAGGFAYDVARGDLGALADAGDAIDLGAVVCLAEDTPDLETAAGADPDVPTPGAGFFYLVRADDRLEPPTYGAGTTGAERTAGPGDCEP